MEQLEEAPVPMRVQFGALNVPVPLLVKLTVPAGVITVPEEESVTVAVHVVCSLRATEVGVQLTVVVVFLLVTVTVVLPELVL